MYAYVVWWTCAWVAVGLVILFGLARTVALEVARMGGKPFVPAPAIPWVASGFVGFALLGLAMLSKVTLTQRKSDLIVFTIGLMVVGFTGFLTF